MSQRPADGEPAESAGPAGSTDTDGTIQDIRLAVVMTGGASLAIWMGGIAREINLLTSPDGPPAAAGVGLPGSPTAEPDATTATAGPGASPAAERPTTVRGLYQALAALLRVQVSVDVLAGTSAGAINAAVLGYANVRGGDLAPLRGLWLTQGAITGLLRDPAGSSFPSLLQGDARLLTGIDAALAGIDASAPPADERPGRPTSLFVTTTFLRPEIDRFTDDLGTVVLDADHHGLFTFGEADLAADGARAQLALAARSSAAFPLAFEPSYVPVGEDAGPQHPDMAGFLNAARGHFVADGGLLDNRPLGPALEAIFERPSERQVRRILAYVLPTFELPYSARGRLGPERPTEPPGLPRALLDDLAAALNQSIAGDLDRLRAHNDAVRVRRDARRRLAALRLASGARLIDADGYAVYRARQAADLAAPVVDAMLRLIADRGDGRLPPQAKARAGIAAPVGAGTSGTTVAGRDELLALAAGHAETFLPARLPGPGDGPILWRLGRPALAAAVTALLTLVREGYVLAADPADRAQLDGYGRILHDALPRAGLAGTRVVWTVVSEALESRRDRDVDGVVADAVTRWLRLDYDDTELFREALTHGWSTVGLVARDLRALLGRLAAAVPPAPAALAPASPPSRATQPAGLSVPARRAIAASYLRVFVDFLSTDPDRCVTELVDLHLAERVLSGEPVVEVAVELVQMSADTRTALDASRSRATQKLTGLQLAHFGAFLKRSWRASDWLWGRLDGAGWLVQALLDPRRLVVLRDLTDAAGRPAWLADLRAGLTRIAGTEPGPAVAGELAFLTADAATVPRSLPETALWVAAGLQRVIAAEELPVVAAAVRTDQADGAGRDTAAGFLAAYDAATAGGRPLAVADAEAVLRACQISTETFAAEAGSPLVTQAIAQTAAVAAAMVSTAGDVPATLRPATWTLRAVTRIAYEVTHRITHGRRDTTTIVALVLLLIGAAAATSTISVVGAVGVLASLAGFTLLGLVVWRRFAQVVAGIGIAAVVLVAAAGLIPALKHHLFGWLGDSAVPYLADHPAAWAAVFLLLLVPPVTTLLGLAAHLRHRHPAPEPPAPEPPTPEPPATALPAAGLPAAGPGSATPSGQDVSTQR